MDCKLLAILRCPKCQSKFNCLGEKFNDHGSIIEGKLICEQCSNEYPIIRSIPRFVPMDNYATSFGYQWNLFKYTQLDIYSKTKESEQRFYSETVWSPSSMKGNWILDAGCGSGRFLEVCSRSDCQVVGVDISSAIDAAGELLKDRQNIHLVQASIYELPFAEGVFDKCYCIGVIQHTPNPKRSIEVLPKFVKQHGQLALTIYERKPWTLFYCKYLFRPITKRMNNKLLLTIIKYLSLILFPLTEVLYRIPFLNKFFKFIIPYANYVHMSSLTMKQRYEWAILDTFDMLSPAYDQPMTESEIRQCLEKTDIKEIKRLANSGVNLIAVK